MNTWEEIIKCMDPISLDKMDEVKLMNRTDTKFTFNIYLFAEILDVIKNDYQVLVINNKHISRYQTLYYDTRDFALYTKHHNGELNRYKIRHRTYVDTNTGYLEVKFKSNKGRTIKERIKEREVPVTWKENCGNFLNQKLPFSYQSLVPKIWVNYSRICLVNKHAPERVTIDLNLEFIQDSNRKSLGQLVIAEVKQDKRNRSPFLAAMKKFHIRPGSISKYCMGVALLMHDVKKNNFKERLNNIKNIINESHFAGR